MILYFLDRILDKRRDKMAKACRLFCVFLVSVLAISLASIPVAADDENRSAVTENEAVESIAEIGDIVSRDPSDRDAGILQRGGLFRGKDSGSRGTGKAAEKSESALFETLYEAIRDWDDEYAIMVIDVSELSVPIEGIWDTLDRFLNENPDLFYVQFLDYMKEGQKITHVLAHMDKQYTRSDVDAFYARIDKILSGVEKYWSDEQKALYIHDYLVTHCEYDNTLTYHNAYDVIVRESAVCQGYALAYDCLMKQCGVECLVVTSYSLNHAWNLVTIDGEKYYVDCTWDDPTTGNGTSWYQDYCKHTNFLRSTEGITSTGHKTTDWIDSSWNDIYSETITGTAYEDAWWSSTVSAIPHVGSAWAYPLKSGRGTCVYIHDYANGADTERFTLNGVWPVWDGQGSFWGASYSHLAACDDYFYVSMYDTIYRFTPDADPEVFYSLTDVELRQGYIYGIRTEDSTLYYRLYTSYDAGSFAGEYCIQLGSEPVVITAHPEDQEVARDATAVFTVTAEGPVASYRWQYKPLGKTKWYNSSSGTEGYDTPELHVVATLARNGFQYRCRITDEDGEEIFSDAALLTVLADPITITAQPEDREVAVGETAYFTVEAEGESLIYQWQYKIVNKTKWYNSSSSTNGYNSPVLEIKGTLARNGYQYRCVITDADGNTLTSDAATLTVYEAPVFGIISQPESQTVEEGETAYFTVVAEGEDLTYKWQYKIRGTSTWRNSSSSTIGYHSAELEVVATAARDGYQYRCIVSDGSGNTETSSVAMLTVTASGPKITSDPQSQTVAAGETAYFTVTATGEGLTYQWQYKPVGKSKWYNSSSATTGYDEAELQVVGTAARSGNQYRCIVTDANGETVTSKAAMLTVE